MLHVWWTMHERKKHSLGILKKREENLHPWTMTSILNYVGLLAQKIHNYVVHITINHGTIVIS